MIFACYLISLTQLSLTSVQNTQPDCSLFTLFQDFQEGNHFFSLFVRRELKPSVASCIRSMCLCPLCLIVTCQRFRARGGNLLRASSAVLRSAFRPQVEGLLVGADNEHTQYTCRGGQASFMGYKRSQRALPCVLMPGSGWEVVHFGFNCVVLCISSGLIMGLYREWVGEDGCMKL